MKNILKLLASVLLIITGNLAVHWGTSLISTPNGKDLDLLNYPFKNSFFSDYFLVGIILFLGPGLFSFFVLLALVLRPEVSSALVIAHGGMLTTCVLVLMGGNYRGKSLACRVSGFRMAVNSCRYFPEAP